MKISRQTKRIIVWLGIIVSVGAFRKAFGQENTEGVITYVMKVNVHRSLPPDRESMKSMIPEFNTSQYQLFFNSNESWFKPVEEEEAQEISGSGFRMSFRRPQNEIYTDQAASKRVSLREFMGKKYLIEDTLKLAPWKFEQGTKEIAGYICQKAVWHNEERQQTITAWYTNNLRPFLGPEGFNTLPGAVLEVDVNDGERVITASQIEFRSLKKYEMKKPTSGVRLTESEFREMVKEQTERMRANGGVFIRN